MLPVVSKLMTTSMALALMIGFSPRAKGGSEAAMGAPRGGAGQATTAKRVPMYPPLRSEGTLD
jgi:hypothetical protein